jgi:hypothetical protein
MKPIRVLSTLSETSRDREEILCDKKCRLYEDKGSWIEMLYEVMNLVKYNDNLHNYVSYLLAVQ